MAASGNPAGDPIRVGREGISYLVSITARALSAEFDDALRHHHLDHGRFIVLRNVLRDSVDRPDGVCVRELADKLIIPADVLAERGRQLSFAGLLTLRGTGEDMLLLPTSKALSLLPVLLDATRWTSERALNSFSREEIETLSSMLHRMMGNLGAE